MLAIKTQRTEQHVIRNKGHPAWAVIDDYSRRSKDLFNYANYLIRQEYFASGKRLTYLMVWRQCKNSEPYKKMGSNVGAQTLRMLDKCWVSFFNTWCDWRRNPQKYRGSPKIPKYKDKDGRYILGIDNIKFAIKDGFIRFSWKPLGGLNGLFRTKIPTGSKLMQCRFVPKGSCYVMEIVYEIDVPEERSGFGYIASIDLGINNFATITNNIGLQPIAIKGGVVKSVNQLYNKRRAKMMYELVTKNRKKWSTGLQTVQNKRNNRLKTLMHKYSQTIVDYCLLSGIDTLICGYNPSWKQKVHLRKETNQTFTSIPYLMFIEQLAYKCKNCGIKFIIQEESYTSGTSAIDGELPISEYYNPKRRRYRGLFVSNNGIEINADVNASYQIMKKVFPNALVEGIAGIGCYPMTIRIT